MEDNSVAPGRGKPKSLTCRNTSWGGLFDKDMETVVDFRVPPEVRENLEGVEQGQTGEC